MSRPRGRFSFSWRRALWIAGLALAGYLLAANLFLNTPLGSWAVNRRPERLEARWQAGWSLFPGHLQVRGLALHSRSSRWQWQLAVERGGGWIDPLGLLGKELRIAGFQGHGVRAAFARRAAEGQSAKAGSKPSSRRRGWTVRLDGLELTGLRELAWGNARLIDPAGRGRLAGSLVLAPGGRSRLSPTRLRMPGSRLILSSRDPKLSPIEAGRELDVAADLAIAPFRVRQHRGADALDFVTGSVRVNGRVPDLQLLAPLGGAPSPRGPGTVRAELRLEKGKLQPGSRLELLPVEPLVLRAAVAPSVPPRLHFAATVDNLTFRRRDGTPWLAAQHLELAAETAELRASRLFAKAAELGRPDPLGPLAAQLAGEGLRFDFGRGPRAWSLVLDRGTGRLDVAGLLRREVRLDGLRAVGGDVEIKAGARPANASARRPRRRGWAVQLRDAELLGLRSLAVRDLRLLGDLTVRGGFSLSAERELSVFPSLLQTAAGTVRRGAEPVADRVSLRLAATAAPSTRNGRERLDAFSGTVATRGRLLQPGAGPAVFDADLRVSAGQLAPGSRLTVQAPSWQFGRGLRLGPSTVQLAVDGGRLRFQADLRRWLLGLRPTGPPLLRSAGLRLATAVSELRLSRLTAGPDRLPDLVPRGTAVEAAANGLELAIAGGRAAAGLTLDRAEGKVDLAGLFAHEVKLSGLRGEGGTGRLDLVVPRSPRGPRRARAWSFDLADARLAGLRSLAIDRNRLVGTALITGSLRYGNDGELEVRSFSLDLPAGELVAGSPAGNQTVGRGIALHATGAAAPFKPREARSPQVIGGLSGQVGLRARVSSLAFLARYLRKMSWLQVQGEGNLSAEVRLERGRLLPGSRLAIDLGRLRARILDSEADGAATLRADVRPTPVPELRLGVDFSRFVLQPAGVPATPWVQGSGLRLGFASRDLDLGAPVQDLRGTVELKEGEVPDLAVYNAYLPPEAGLAVTSGRGRLAFRLRLDAGSGDGDFTLTSDDLQARFLDLHLGGRLRLAAHLAEADLERRRFALGGTRLDLTDIAYAEEGQAPRVEDAGWWARVTIPRGTLVWSKPLQIQGRVEARLRDAGLLLSLFAQRSRFLDWFDSLLHVDDVQVRGDVRVGGGVAEVDPFRATGDNLDLRSRLRLAAGSRRGDLYVRYKKLKVGIALRDGERAFKLRRPEEWFESRGRVDD